MTFSTKGGLKANITVWMARSDLTSYYDDMISLAEAELNRNVPLLRLFETNTTLTGVTSSASLTLPTDYLAPVGLQVLNSLTTTGYRELVPMTFDQMETTTITGAPAAWAVTGSTITLNRPCDQAYSFNFRYYQSFSLANDASTNSLLTAAPDVYLAACMVQANILAKDNQAVGAWQAKLDGAIDSVASLAAMSKRKAILTVDRALLTRNRPWSGTYYGGWI